MASDHPGLDPSDTAELGELLTFLSDWLGSGDSAQLAASLSRFVGTTGYELDELRLDLNRFAFLLGADDGVRLFDIDPS